MTFRVSFNASGLSRTLNSASKDIHKKIVEAVNISVRDVQERARAEHRFTSRTGQAEESIHTAVEEHGGKIVGMVYTSLPHAVYLHQGTKAHTIVPRAKEALRWTDGKKFVFAKRANVSGIKADPYIFNAYEKEKTAIISRMDAIMKELK